MAEQGPEPIIRVRGLEVSFGAKAVLKGLDLDVPPREVTGFVGGSGQGKSVLTRAILGLVPKQAGTIEVFGEDIDKLSPVAHRALERRWGVMFQGGLPLVHQNECVGAIGVSGVLSSQDAQVAKAGADAVK